MRTKRLWILMIGLWLTLLLCVAVSAETVAEGTCGDNLTWVLDEDGVLTIEGNGEIWDCDSGSSHPWYSYRDSITSVIIEEGVTAVGNGTFYGCTGLMSISLPKTVETIGSYAFAECKYLKTIHVLGNLVYLNSNAFYNCTALRKAYFYENAPKIFSFRAFTNTHSAFTIYYIEGKSGWTTPTWCDFNTAIFDPQELCTAGVDAPDAVITGDLILIEVPTKNAHNGVSLTVAFDTILQFDEASSDVKGAIIKFNQDNTLTITDTAQNEDMVYILAFSASSSMTASVRLISAIFTDMDGGTYASMISPSKSTINIADILHEVNIADIFIGSTVAAEGFDYTFYLDDEYNYTDIVVTVGGIPIVPIDNEDGSYTIENVCDGVVITGTRTPKKCKITFVRGSGSSVSTVDYGSGYVLVDWLNLDKPLSEIESIVFLDGIPTTIEYGSAIYYYNEAVEKAYTFFVVPGSITCDVIVTVRTITPKTVAACWQGAVSSLIGYTAYVEPGEDYVLSLPDDMTDDYTLIAMMGGNRIPVVKEDRVFTIAGSDITEGLLVLSLIEKITLQDDSPYILQSTTVTNVPTATTVSDFRSNFTNAESITITTASGTVLTDTAYVGTGCVISTTTGDTLTILVTGDLTGDGLSDSGDLTLLQQYYCGYPVAIAYPTVADLNGDGRMTRADVMILSRRLTGWTDITTPSGENT